MRRSMMFAVALSLAGTTSLAQTLAGTLIGTVQDAQGGVLPGVVVRVSFTGADRGRGHHAHQRDRSTEVSLASSGVYALEIEAPRFNRITNAISRLASGRPREDDRAGDRRRRAVGRGRRDGIAH